MSPALTLDDVLHADRPACTEDLLYRYEPRKPKPRPLIVKMLRLWGRHLHLYFASVPTNVGAVEDALLAAFMPPFNTDLPGKLAAIGKVIYHT